MITERYSRDLVVNLACWPITIRGFPIRVHEDHNRIFEWQSIQVNKSQLPVGTEFNRVLANESQLNGLDSAPRGISAESRLQDKILQCVLQNHNFGS